MSRNEKLETLLVRDPFARRRPKAVACLIQGTVGECAGHRAERLPVWRSGMLLVVAEYFAFVLLSLWGGTRAPKNISICGYLELLPDWVAFLYMHVAAAGVDCTLFMALAVARKETAEGHAWLGVIRAGVITICALCLAGFSAIPRCLWNMHQSSVLCWVCATSFAMFLGTVRDRTLEGYSVFPFLSWSVGTYFCVSFYYESSMRFYVAEATTVVAYVLWCSNGHAAYVRKKFTMLHFFIADGTLGAAVLLAFRYNQNYACEVTGKWRLV